MADIRFTRQQIERFSDRIKNCLEDQNCRQVLLRYLKVLKKPMYLNALTLWEAAIQTTAWEEEVMMELIEDVDGFNENPLLSINECQHKIDYTKEECCRIIEKALPGFVEYLKRHHRSRSC